MSTDKIAKKGLHGIIYEYFGMFIISITGVISYIVLIRYLTKTEYGVFSVFKSAFAFLFLLIAFGLPHIFQRYIPEFLEKNQKNKAVLLVKKSFILFSFIFFISTLIILIFRNEIFQLLKLDYSWALFLLFILGLLSICFLRIFNMVLHSSFRQKQFNLTQAIAYILKLILFVVVSIYNWGLEGIIYAFVISNIFWFIIKVYLVRDFLFGEGKLFQPLPLKRMFKFGIFKYLNDMGTIILDVLLDILIISAILGTKKAGEYAFAVSIATMITAWYPGRLGIRVIIPIFIQQYTKNKDKNQLSELLIRMIKLISFVAIPVMLISVMFSEQIISNIFNSAYLNTNLVFIIAVLSFSIYHIFAPGFNAVLTTLEKSNILFYSRIFTVYNLVMDIILINYYGILGAIIATGTTLLFIIIFQAVLISKYIKLKVPGLAFVKIIINIIPSLIILFLIKNYITNIYTTILSILGAILLFGLISLVNKVFTDEEREFYNLIIGRNIFKF